MYATTADIQSRLPFELDTDSIPTSTEVATLQANVNRFINGYIGVSTDKTDSQALNDLRWVEQDLTVMVVMALHDGRVPSFTLQKEHEALLDNHRSKSNVSIHEYTWGR